VPFYSEVLGLDPRSLQPFSLEGNPVDWQWRRAPEHSSDWEQSEEPLGLEWQRNYSTYLEENHDQHLQTIYATADSTQPVAVVRSISNLVSP